MNKFLISILKNNNHHQQQKAFTMIELLVSISIIIMLTIMFVANYHSSNKRTDLIMTAQNLVANIHLAQNDALGLVKYGGAVPAGGWGLHLSTATSTYILFADLNAPGTTDYMSYQAVTEGKINNGARLVQLPPGIVISKIQVSKNNSSRSVAQADITFLPPDPQTNIYDSGTGATSTKLFIQLKETSNNSLKTVEVNFLGLAEVTN